MIFASHFRFLWNGGLDPDTVDPSKLRQRRTLSTTAFLLIPVGMLLMVSNLYTEAERDNPHIAAALVVVLACIYLQAYFNSPRAAANLGIAAFWLVVVAAMTSVGVWGKAWVWLLPIAPIATLVSNRLSGTAWTLLCMASLWTFALLQNNGYVFEFAQELTGDSPIYIAIEGSMILLMLSIATFVFRTAQTRTEQMLTNAVEKLEVEVAERKLAEDEARRSEQNKSAFLAAMSHELRTPLNGVIGATKLLQDSHLSPGKEELVNIILESSESLLELSNNVLDLSSLDSGAVLLERIPVDIRELVNKTLVPLQFQAKKKGFNISCQFEDDLPHLIVGDPTRLRQILINLVGNAVKFTDKGEVTVVVDLAFERLRFRIKDTGVGIPKHAQATLFEPYVQADVETMRRYGGSGLGLAIVKKLVNAMGGKIMIQSVPLEGSTFTFFIPLEKATRVPITKAGATARTLNKLRLLVVDDNAVNRMVLARLLEKDQHDVVSVASGREALDYLSDHTVDAVLMDILMPGMDGVTTMKRIRAMDSDISSVPVIAITANVKKDDAKIVLDSGMDGFVGKPFRYEELLVVLQKALRKSRPTQRSVD
ncbi:MAG: ATP-binding protein [Pseudohongiellaceae bacterium]